jgi:hypothetical protein
MTPTPIVPSQRRAGIGVMADPMRKERGPERSTPARAADFAQSLGPGTDAATPSAPHDADERSTEGETP